MTFKVKDGLSVGANTIIDASGNLTVPGKTTLSNTTTAGSSLNLGTGTADPTTPATGDVWNNTGVLKIRQAAATKTIAFLDSTITGNAANVTGTVAIANGGTNGSATPTAGAVPYGTGTAFGFTAAGTSGQYLTSAGAGVPVWVTLPTTIANATNVGITDDVATATSQYLYFGSATSGNTPVKSSSTRLTFVPSTGNLTTIGSVTVGGNGVVFGGSTSGTTNVKASAIAGTTTITLPATTGTVVTTGDTGTVTSTMITDGTIVNADINASAAIAVSKLAASTISGVTLGNNLSALTISTGLIGTSYNGSTPITIALATSGVTAGSYGTATSIPSITVDTYGRITAASGNAITIGAGTLGASTVTAGATNTTVALNFSAAYNANSTTNVTINPVVGPAITALSTIMTGATTGVLSKSGADSYSLVTNIATATALQTARTIQGVSFDGTANITVVTAGTGVGVVGTAVSIGQAVATSSNVQFNSIGVGVAGSGTAGQISAANIVSSGNITPTVTNTQTLGSAGLLWNNVYATTFTGALSGNATTATALATSRTLWGQAFTGAANVTGSLTSVGNITGTGAVTLTATAGTLGLAATGANLITASTNGTVRLTINGSGQAYLGGSPGTGDSFTVNKNITGNVNGYGVVSNGTIQTDATTSGNYYLAYTATAASGTPYTIATVRGFYSEQGTFGTNTTVTDQIGFAAGGLIGATSNYGFLAGNTAAVAAGKTAYGFFSNINTATGGGTTWGFYAAGTAPNYFAGNIGVATGGTALTYKLTMLGDNAVRLFNTAGTNDSYISFPSAQVLQIATYHASGSSLVFATAPSGGGTAERMRIDANGNLGLGVTPSAWAGSTAFQFGTTGAVYAGAGATYFAHNFASTAGGNLRLTTGSANFYAQDGAHKWFNAPSAAAGTTATFTQAMTLDASGNLGIGTSSPVARLDVRAESGDHLILSRATPTQSPTYIKTNADLSNLTLQAGSTANFFSSVEVMGWNGTGNTPRVSFYTAGSERMRLDASGNLGVGVTPSAWGTVFKALQVGGGGTVSGSSTQVNFSNNWVNTSTGDKYIANGFASAYTQVSGRHQWYNAPSGTAGDAITFTPSMTLDASGNLLVGTTSAGYSLANRGLVEVNGTSSALFGFRVGGVNKGYLLHEGTNLYVSNDANGALIFNTNSAERLRIDASGNVTPGVTNTQTLGAVGDVWSKVHANTVSAIFHESVQTINVNYTITSGSNAMTPGPITIASGITVTVPTGSVWTIV